MTEAGQAAGAPVTAGRRPEQPGEPGDSGEPGGVAGADGRAGIDAGLVGRLVAAQFPRWRDLPITPVPVDGWDNRTYRLGPDLSARLPTAAGYVAAVEKEHRWLPVLAPHLPVPIPRELGLGRPGEGYPFPWSVRSWLDGVTARPDRIADLPGFAVQLAGFLRELQAVDPTGGPAAGEHCWYRGASLEHYDGETRYAVRQLQELDGAAGRLRAMFGWDAGRVLAAWDEALAATWSGAPVWFHGDIAHGNLLVRDSRLVAVIDFGTSGVGDPACDLVIAWTFFSGPGRRAFAEAVGADPAMWARARGWALWKELIGLPGRLESGPQPRVDRHSHLLNDLLDDRIG